MAQIIGKYIKYDRVGIVEEVEYPGIEVEIGTIVEFTDNSYLNNCYINSPDGEDIDACGAWKEPFRWTGKVVKTNSVQYAEDTQWSLGHRRLEMPIAVICDNGEIIYCNPLNIRVIN